MQLILGGDDDGAKLPQVFTVSYYASCKYLFWCLVSLFYRTFPGLLTELHSSDIRGRHRVIKQKESWLMCLILSSQLLS